MINHNGIEFIEVTDENRAGQVDKKRRFNRPVALLGIAATMAGLFVYARGHQEFARDECTNVTNAFLDVNTDATSLTNISRTFLNRNSQDYTLTEFVEGVADKRGYYINPSDAVALNPDYSEYSDRAFDRTMTACINLPKPVVKEYQGITFVLVPQRENYDELTIGKDGKPDPKKIAAIAGVNIDENPAEGYMFLPVSSDIITRITQTPEITDEQIKKTKEQAQEIGLIG